jgi:hypothetical protein
LLGLIETANIIGKAVPVKYLGFDMRLRGLAEARVVREILA